MPVVPPERNVAPSKANYPWWTLIGPGLATVIGLFMLTAVYGTDQMSPIQLDLGLSGSAFLMVGVVAYLIAGAVAFLLGLLLGGRFPTAVTVPAAGVMLVGALLVAFGGPVGPLLVGRVLGGLGAGAAAGATTALVLRIRGPRGIAAAVVAALGVLAAVVAPFVNQGISAALSFRMTFLAAVPLSFVALLACAVGGIALSVMSRRPAQPGPAGVPYPSQGPHR
jgi:MFS family permease